MVDEALKKACQAILEDVDNKDIEEAINGYKAKLNSDIRKKINDSLRNKNKKIFI